MEQSWPKFDKPFYFHMERDSEVTNGVTVCAIPVDKEKKLFRFGSAMAHDQDTYCKKIGRTIAEGRARDGESFTVNDFASLKEMVQNIVNARIEKKLQRINKSN